MQHKASENPHEGRPRIAFFGTPDRAVWVLDRLKAAGMPPALVVTQPDRPQGRKFVMTPPPAKVWAEREGIPVIQPEKIDAATVAELASGGFDLFVVVAYGKILKKEVLSLPKKGALNLHGSLLPRLRGSSPIETAILNDERHTGASIILMDELMDHGPILGERAVEPEKWPLPANELARLVVDAGADLLVEIIPAWLSGKIEPREQDHTKATLTKKISKEDGEIDLSADPYKNFLKYNAYKEWPRTFFFAEKGGKRLRVVIADASYENGAFVVRSVVPEGKKEMSWKAFTD